MITIYVVEGQTGEYSDHRYWSVRAFTNEQKAEDFCDKVKARALELLAKYGTHYNIPSGANEFDPSMSIDYTGIEYFVYELDLDNEEHS